MLFHLLISILILRLKLYVNSRTSDTESTKVTTVVTGVPLETRCYCSHLSAEAACLHRSSYCAEQKSTLPTCLPSGDSEAIKSMFTHEKSYCTDPAEARM